MECVRHRAVSLFFVLVSASPLAAQDVSAIDRVSTEDCARLLPDPEAALADLAPTHAQTSVFSLILEALTRRCAALGEIPMPDEGDSTETRAPGPAEQAEDDVVRLTREARYYLETAMQIDPDAANDLLRRLLGNGPGPSE